MKHLDRILTNVLEILVYGVVLTAIYGGLTILSKVFA